MDDPSVDHGSRGKVTWIANEFTGSSLEGPPGCGGFLLSCILCSSGCLSLHSGFCVSLYSYMFEHGLCILYRASTRLEHKQNPLEMSFLQRVNKNNETHSYTIGRTLEIDQHEDRASIFC